MDNLCLCLSAFPIKGKQTECHSRCQEVSSQGNLGATPGVMTPTLDQRRCLIWKRSQKVWSGNWHLISYIKGQYRACWWNITPRLPPVALDTVLSNIVAISHLWLLNIWKIVCLYAEMSKYKLPAGFKTQWEYKISLTNWVLITCWR